MIGKFVTPVSQPMIVKYVDSEYNGIRSNTLSRYAIGCVLRGTKYIYDGDIRRPIRRGDLFYLGIGHHYTENIPDGTQPFEEVTIFYTPTELHRILMHLNIAYGLDIVNGHSCEECSGSSFVITPGWASVRSFFGNANSYLHDEQFLHDQTAESIKMTELIYNIISHDSGCLRSKLLGNIDMAKENFEQVVHDHIFRDVSIDELAKKTNRSLTSFKKEFKQLFRTSPHKWFIRQRLQHARLLLTSTSLSISEIGSQCTFPNTSHFIKLFKKEYDLTPAAYRNRHAATRDNKVRQPIEELADVKAQSCEA